MMYLVNGLSSDAVPTIVSFLERPDWREGHMNWQGSTSVLEYWKKGGQYDYQFRYLKPDIDARLLTVSDIQAKQLIESMPRAQY